MNDPKRILDGPAGDQVTALEQELLSSLGPSDYDKKKVLGRVLSQAGVAAAVGTAATVSTQSAAAAGKSTLGASALAVKWKVLVLALAPVGIGAGYFALRSPDPETAPAVVTKPVSPGEPARQEVAPLPPAEEVVAEEPGQRVASSASKPPVARTVPSSPAASALEEENRLVRKAREKWKAGDRIGALRTLDELDRRFSKGVLLAERRMLRASIESEVEPTPATSRPASSE